jgi:NAD(P)-dependent dehydrogenase (short-subunit alcohol dehydrogenase family)
MSIWFITGATRGFGRALTEAALAAGHKVVATARDVGPLTAALAAHGEAAAVLPLDVTDEGQARAAVHAARERFGALDVVVNNAGYGLFGSVEETPLAEVRRLFDTNVFGMLNVTRAVAPVLREQQSGHIVNMSSSAGFAAGAGRGLYAATKFAVEGISEALREELAGVGVHVTLVEPGSFRTDFLTGTSRRLVPVSIAAYESTVGTLLEWIAANDGRQPGDPAAAVQAILALAEMPQPPLRLQLGSDAVALVETKLATVAREMAVHRSLSLSTDFASDDR